MGFMNISNKNLEIGEAQPSVWDLSTYGIRQLLRTYEARKTKLFLQCEAAKYLLTLLCEVNVSHIPRRFNAKLVHGKSGASYVTPPESISACLCSRKTRPSLIMGLQ
ncbi:hypothetical protein AMTR_s00112p00020820, partial [Amborella trichopoda]